MADPIEVLSDDFVISINTGADISPYSSSGSATWTPILGLKSHRWSEANTKEVDASNRSTRGRGQTRIVRRGNTLTFGGNFFEDSAGARDPGQAAVEALAANIIPDDLGWFSYETPGGVVKYFQGTAKMADEGGDLDTLCEWGASVDVYGEIYDSWS